MSAPIAPIAGALAQHAAVGFGECRCGWTVEVLIGQSWREHHELHQAEAVAALPEVLGRIRELERKNTTLGIERVRLHDARDRVAVYGRRLTETPPSEQEAGE